MLKCQVGGYDATVFSTRQISCYSTDSEHSESTFLHQFKNIMVESPQNRCTTTMVIYLTSLCNFFFIDMYSDQYRKVS